MTKNGEKNISNREVKNSAFTTFFGEPENASQLYAALGEVEVSPEDITYVTLEGVLFIARKNDLAFTVKNRVLVISEHQSTINENMPLRDLIYLGRTLEKLLDEKNLYRRKLIRIIRDTTAGRILDSRKWAAILPAVLLSKNRGGICV